MAYFSQAERVHIERNPYALGNSVVEGLVFFNLLNNIALGIRLYAEL